MNFTSNSMLNYLATLEPILMMIRQNTHTEWETEVIYLTKELPKSVKNHSRTGAFLINKDLIVITDHNNRLHQ